MITRALTRTAVTGARLPRDGPRVRQPRPGSMCVERPTSGTMTLYHAALDAQSNNDRAAAV